VEAGSINGGMSRNPFPWGQMVKFVSALPAGSPGATIGFAMPLNWSL